MFWLSVMWSSEKSFLKMKSVAIKYSRCCTFNAPHLFSKRAKISGICEKLSEFFEMQFALNENQ